MRRMWDITVIIATLTTLPYWAYIVYHLQVDVILKIYILILFCAEITKTIVDVYKEWLKFRLKRIKPYNKPK